MINRAKEKVKRDMRMRIKKFITNIPGFLSTLKWCLKLSWKTSKLYTALRIFFEVLAPVLTIVVTFIGRNVINLLAGQSDFIGDTERILLYLIGGLFIVAIIRGSSQKLVQ